LQRASLSRPGRAAAWNAAAQSRDPGGATLRCRMGPGSAERHFAPHRVRGTGAELPASLYQHQPI